MAFGIGVGLKDGVGKASEFFAGYVAYDISTKHTISSVVCRFFSFNELVDTMTNGIGPNQMRFIVSLVIRKLENVV